MNDPVQFCCEAMGRPEECKLTWGTDLPSRCSVWKWDYTRLPHKYLRTNKFLTVDFWKRQHVAFDGNLWIWKRIQNPSVCYWCWDTDLTVSGTYQHHFHLPSYWLVGCRLYPRWWTQSLSTRVKQHRELEAKPSCNEAATCPLYLLYKMHHHLLVADLSIL